MENCISCGHAKSRHYDALGTGCKETPAGFPCRCGGYMPCPSCAALRAQLARVEDVEGMEKVMYDAVGGWLYYSSGGEADYGELVYAVQRFVKEGKR